MSRSTCALLVLAGLWAGWPRAAGAVEGCGAGAQAGSLASEVAAIACAEHELWYAPFIDEHGRLAHIRVSEAEGLRLRDGSTPAWRRVAEYWRASGLRWPPPGFPPGADCLPGATDAGAALCRVFLVDTPWSAVFVSWVMGRAGVDGFARSARHVDYVRDAFRQPDRGPYRLADPDLDTPAVGDLMCFARGSSQVLGAAGFRRWLQSSGAGALAMHCDIVVAATDDRARLVGGNVLQGVTMRVLPLNRAGRFWSLPRRMRGQPECHPSNATACNLHRQDWVALLKLDPALAARRARNPVIRPVPAQPCCEICTLPLPAGMRRCTAPSDPAALPAG
jgi:hypothetical protein